MRRVSIALLSGLLAMHGSAALAVDFADGFYWGVNAGVSEDRDFCGQFPPAIQFAEIPGCDDKDFTYWDKKLKISAKWATDHGYSPLDPIRRRPSVSDRKNRGKLGDLPKDCQTVLTSGGVEPLKVGDELPEVAVKAATSKDAGPGVPVLTKEQLAIALGEKPKKGGSEQLISLVEGRQRLGEKVDGLLSAIKRADQLALRAEQLINALEGVRRSRFKEQLFARVPGPLTTEFWHSMRSDIGRDALGFVHVWAV